MDYMPLPYRNIDRFARPNTIGKKNRNIIMSLSETADIGYILQVDFRPWT